MYGIMTYQVVQVEINFFICCEIKLDRNHRIANQGFRVLGCRYKSQVTVTRRVRTADPELSLNGRSFVVKGIGDQATNPFSFSRFLNSSLRSSILHNY